MGLRFKGVAPNVIFGAYKVGSIDISSSITTYSLYKILQLRKLVTL